MLDLWQTSRKIYSLWLNAQSTSGDQLLKIMEKKRRMRDIFKSVEAMLGSLIYLQFKM